MEENVALDTSKQKQFVKSIKGIKKLIKKAKGDAPEIVVPKQKDGKKQKRKRPERGLVYLSHIPHGFYEHEMTQYFSQFGLVTNVRVIRSKRTGNSKGFAFVEFKQPEVAEIVAETMNNYLMGKRLIKAACIPAEKQKIKALRKNWSRLNNPTRTERLKQKKAYNENKDTAGELARARRYLSNYRKNMKKLRDIGINYDFFTPVDIPKELKENLNEAENKNSEKDLQNKDNKKQKNKENKQSAPKKKEKEEQKQVDSTKEKKTKASTNKNIKDIKESEQKVLESKKGKKTKTPEPVVNKKEQKQKQLKLKDAGVKAPENFMKLQKEGDSDSDSSADFDSDDYSKMIEDDSDADSGDNDSDIEDESGDDESDEFEVTGSDDDESDADESEDEEIIPPPKKGKGPTIHAQPVQKKGKGPIPPPVSVHKKQAKTGNQMQTHQSKSIQNKGPKAPVDQKDPKVKGPKAEQKVHKGPAQQKGPQAPELGKRKAPQKTDASPKKPKFEKQTQQPMKKQFKKQK